MNTKMLIADDEIDIVQMLSGFFESKGYLGLSALNRKEALKHSDQRKEQAEGMPQPVSMENAGQNHAAEKGSPHGLKLVVGNLDSLYPCMLCQQPIFRGSNTDIFLKLAHKMQIGLIPTENTQLIDVHIGSGQIKFGKLYPGKNDIMLA